MRKLKKVVLAGSLIILFFLLMLLFPKKDEMQSTMAKDKNTYPFYKAENKERYLKYQNQHPELEEIDVITRVNLNLDQPFYTNTKEADNLQSSSLLVSKYRYLKEDYIPKDLEEISSCVEGTRLLVKDARIHFEKLCESATKENMKIRAISSYRSYAYQKKLYNNYVQKDGVELADTYSARPGFSEHQTGLVVDIDNYKTDYNHFETTKEFTWMQENAYKYGFILRYPKGKEEITGYDYEAWHYRYVGVDIATAIHNTNLTLDEYYVRFLEK